VPECSAKPPINPKIKSDSDLRNIDKNLKDKNILAITSIASGAMANYS
jgi:hypothetical protein